MYTKQFPVQFSVLLSSALEESILSKYSIEKPFKCQFYTKGINDIYLVNSLTSKYYLRISAANWRTKEELEAEVNLLIFLYKKGVPVSIPIKDKEGIFIHEILAPEGIRYAVLFTEAKGVYKDNPNESQNTALGNVVARFHNYSDSFDLTEKRLELNLAHLIDDPLIIIKPYFMHRAKDYECLIDIGNMLKEYVQQNLSQSKPEYGICHGDIHRGNIHFLNDKNSLTLFDFDCFGYGWRSYDIAVYLWNHQSDQPVPENCDSKQKQWDDFLNGYNEVRQLKPNEINATRAFVAIRDIWLLGVQLNSLNRNRGCDWLNDEYFDFHLNFIKQWVDL